MRTSFILTLAGVLLPAVIYAQSWKPLSKTCDNFGHEAASAFLKMSVADFEQLNDQAGMKYLKNLYESKDYYDTFLVLISPSLSIAEKSIRLNMIKLMEKSCGDKPSDDSLITVLTELKPCLSRHFASLKTTHTQMVEHEEFLQVDVSNNNGAQQLLNNLCEKLSIKPPHCRSEMISFFDLIAPSKQSPMITATQDFLSLSTNPQLTKLSVEFSLYYIDVLIASVKNGGPMGKDVFIDLVKFFEKKGFKNPAARKLAFKFLGVYGARGASFLMSSGYYSGKGNDYGNAYAFHPASHAAMAVLSLGISYLDKLAHEQNRSYALPHAYRTSCHAGKPYHFWMAASLAQYAKRQGFNDLTAYYGPVMAGVAYDMIANYNGRDIKKLFEIKTPYDFYANMTRIDNWVRAMGAHFGRHNGKVLPVNAEGLLEDMFEKSRMPQKIPGVDKKVLLEEYNRIVQPVPLILKLSL